MMLAETMIHNPGARILEMKLFLTFNDGELVGWRVSNLEACPMVDFRRAEDYLKKITEQGKVMTEQGKVLRLNLERALQVEKEKRIHITQSRKVQLYGSEDRT